MAPAVTVDADGAVVATAVLAAPEAAIRALLADGRAATVLSPDVLSATAEPADGGCERIHKQTRGVLRPFDVVSLRCPTASGWHESLVESKDFSALTTDWVITPTDGGTRVELRVLSAITWPVPAGMVRNGLEDGVRRTVEALAAKLGP